MACPASPSRPARCLPRSPRPMACSGSPPTRAWPGSIPSRPTATPPRRRSSSPTWSPTTGLTRVRTACTCPNGPTVCASATTRSALPARSACGSATGWKGWMHVGRTPATATRPSIPTLRPGVTASVLRPPTTTACGMRAATPWTSSSSRPSSKPGNSRPAARWRCCWRSASPGACVPGRWPHACARVWKSVTVNANASPANCTTPCCRAPRG